MNRRSLTKQSEFKEVYERGAKRVGRLLVVYLLVADDDASAVVASRKVGNAVRRNRAKRLLREARRLGCLGTRESAAGVHRTFFPDQDGPPSGANTGQGLWVVLVARTAILAAGSAEVTAELDALLGSPA